MTIPQPFYDWYGIFAGSTSIDDNRFWTQDIPVGLHLAVQTAQKSDIFIAPEHPWEEGGLTPQIILCDDGIVKMWYLSRGADESQPTFIAYAESDEGFNWRRPQLTCKTTAARPPTTCSSTSASSSCNPSLSILTRRPKRATKPSPATRSSTTGAPSYPR